MLNTIRENIITNKTFVRYRSLFQAKWRVMSVREQRLVSVFVIAIALLLFYMFLAQPLHQKTTAMQLSIKEKQQTTAWLSHNKEAIDTLKNEGIANTIDSQLLDLPLASLIENIGMGNIEKSAVQKMQADNDNSFSMSFSAVDFDSLIEWVSRLQSYQVEVQNLRVESLDSITNSQDATGFVNAELSLIKK